MGLFKNKKNEIPQPNIEDINIIIKNLFSREREKEFQSYLVL